MNVAHVGPDPAGSGGMAAVIRAHLVPGFAGVDGAEAIVTWRHGGLVTRIRAFSGGLVSLVRFCRRPGLRVVHVHVTVRGSMLRKAVVVSAARALGQPVVLHVHSGRGDIAAFDEGLGRLRRAVVRRSFARADRVVAVSAATAAELERRWTSKPIAVVPNPAPQLADVAPATRNGAVTLVYLGGFANPVKGAEPMLAALPAMLDGAPGARVVLAGPGEPPPRARELEGDRVTLAGWLDPEAAGRLLAGCDVFVLPSLSEGLPVALLEAMSAGRAIVATSVGGVPEVVEGGVDALVVPPGDPDALAAAAVRLLRDPDERDRLGQAARARAKRLNVHEVGARLEAIYRDLTAA